MARTVTGQQPIRAVAFDCYGTLLRIVDRRRPFERLARAMGARPSPSPLTTPLTLTETADRCFNGSRVDARLLVELEADVDAEVRSVEAIGDALAVLADLRCSGYRLAVVSNLAAPYARPIRSLLSGFVDVEVLSFEIGTAKPAPSILEETCRRLGRPPATCLMVGDSLASDVYGAISADMQARLVTRDRDLRTLLQDVLTSPK